MKLSVSDAVSASKYSKNVKKGPWIVLFYANWCGHCTHMKPEWNKFKSSIPKGLNVAEVENSSMPLLEKTPEIRGFPTIKMFKDNVEVDEFKESERTKENIMRFANNNHTSNNHSEPSDILNNIVKDLKKVKSKKVKKSIK